MARNNLAGYNNILKNGIKYRWLGKNGNMYEYILPYGSNTDRFYEEAIDVRSIKWGRARSSSQNGKFYRKGEYQPIGDKRYFNFYQLKQMYNRGEEDRIKIIKDIIRRFYIKDYE